MPTTDLLAAIGRADELFEVPPVIVKIPGDPYFPFPGQIHHLLRQVDSDVAVERVHRDSAGRRVLVHARIRLHSDQHNAEIRMLYKCLRTSPRWVHP